LHVYAGRSGAVVISFEVHGTPKPQGSMKAFAVGGKARMKASGGTEFAAWRNAVAEAARRQADEHGTLDGPLSLDVVFRFPMPASRPKKVRDRGLVWRTTMPDVDKLVRCLCDGLTASGLIADDARIVQLAAIKCETTSWSGAHIELGPARELFA
jgi:Holliday junction resolvase RusA-like endonuclease